MRLLLKAGTAFLFAALLGGKPVPGSHWQAVATELHQAQPQVRLKAQAASLFHIRF